MKDIITYCEIRKSFTRLEVLLFDRSCKKHKVVTQANNTNLFNLKKNKKNKETKTKNRKNKTSSNKNNNNSNRGKQQQQQVIRGLFRTQSKISNFL